MDRRLTPLIVLWLVVGGCATYRGVSSEQGRRVRAGQCAAGATAQGLVVVSVEGAVGAALLHAITLEHVESGRHFGLRPGRTVALLPVGTYRFEEWLAVEDEGSASSVYRGAIDGHDVPPVEPGRVVSWGRYRLRAAGEGGAALAHAAGAVAASREEDGRVAVRWDAGEEAERFDAGACLTAGGRVSTQTARFDGLTVEAGGAVSLLGGTLGGHGGLLRPADARKASDLAAVGGAMELGLGYSLGGEGYPEHQLGLSFMWAGHGLTAAGRELVLAAIDPGLGVTDGDLVAMQVGAAWTWRPLIDWVVSPLVGAGTGVTIANVGNVEPAESEPDLAWSVRLSAGVDARVSDEVGLRLTYAFAAPLAGAPLPLSHTLTLSVSIVVGGLIEW